MAQLNITLNQDEVLQLLAENSGEAFKTLLSNCLNAVLQAQSYEQIGVGRYERAQARTGGAGHVTASLGPQRALPTMHPHQNSAPGVRYKK